MRIKVKLVSVNPFTCKKFDERELYPPALESFKKWGGKYVEVGPPMPAPPGCTCNTDFVWPVLTREFVTDSGYENVMLCRHQIEAGD